MNAVWNSYGQLCGCPEIFKKSCKFFCRELDIRVTHIMEADFWRPICFTIALKWTYSVLKRTNIPFERVKIILYSLCQLLPARRCISFCLRLASRRTFRAVTVRVIVRSLPFFSGVYIILPLSGPDAMRTNWR